MNHLKYIVIYSNSPARLLDFFSDVLECEIDFKAQSFHLNGQAFHIKKNFTSQNNDNSSLLPGEFCFDVEALEDAEILLKRFNFYQYRNNDKLYESIEFKDENSVRILEITDFDGRKWLFSSKKTGYFDVQSF